MSAKSLLAAAKQASQTGRWDTAADLARQAVETEPLNVEARLVLGIILATRDESAEALASFESVLRLEPGNFPALNWAGMLHCNHGDPAVGAECCRRAIGMQPGNPEPHFNLGMCLDKLGRPDEAVPELRRAVKIQPNRPNFLTALGRVLRNLDRISEAIEMLREAARIAPIESAMLDLMEAQIAIGRPDDALATGEEAHQRFPDSVMVAIMCARASEALHDAEQTRVHLERAKSLDPNQLEIFVLEGKLAQAVGDLEQTEQSFRQAIKIDPKLGAPYLGIVSSRRMTRDDADFIEEMRAVAVRPDLHPSQRSELLYSIAKSFDDLGEYELAIGYFDQANQAHKAHWLRNRRFDPGRVHQETSQRIKLYTPGFFKKAAESADTSDLPIVVLGMMRSGTTLVEQILSAHPKVGGAGEVNFWASREDWYVDFKRGQLDTVAIVKAGREYLDRLGSLVPGSSRATDKNPANVMVAGLIHAALPNARIIHTRRDPVDTVLSMWITPVLPPPPFCCDRANIVAMYREYERLAEHWRSVLPPDRYLEVSYEALTGNPEPTIREMLEFLELEFDDRCLHPEDNTRAVNTPSLWQVRRPLNQNSVARWKRYEPWISEFLQLRD